ncbi:hypothetical protein G6O69_06185 [Pseudenhygromyxa sp. WMMC2535]|uniref:hypothetical protein n=1 Tax=Pseudenhygromyxa sp. WMMC2535 TaxID=2712867 RepID=UPI001555F33A|nr:hypothetical protein [Pseudenhygromyxa sp. WMMC2535]NVB37412.1 hypothetical protein [Pseudenhygromyxa sp. WMMC2535]
MSLNPDKLVEQLLDQGMTEQQITDLVAQEILRSRRHEPESGAKANDDAADQPDRTPDDDAPYKAGETSAVGIERSEPSGPTETKAADVIRRVVQQVNASDPDGPREAMVLMSEYLSESHSGPLPSPRQALAYESILPGFTERCLVDYEANNQAMRNSLAKRDRRLDRGQVFALVFALTCLLCGLTFAVLGYAKVGGAVIVGVIGAVVSAFLATKKRPAKALRESTEEADTDR